MTTARQKTIQARVSLVLDQPFFGALALRLKIVEDPGCGTAWTDGVSLGYDPEFVNRLTADEVEAVVAHEVLHCANGHVWRRDGREHQRFNVACDLAINPVLKEAGFRLPEGVLLDPQVAGKSAEWIYARLPETPKQGGGGKSGKGAAGAGQAQGQGKGKGQAGAPPCDAQGGAKGATGPDAATPGAGACDVRDAPTGGAEADGCSEADWRQAVQQAAAAAKGRGRLPASLARLAQQAAESRVDWRSVVLRWAQERAREDYSWSRPSQRYLAQGLYLPSLYSEETGPIGVQIDTSGSIDSVLLGQFKAALQAVVDQIRPRRVYVGYTDAKCHRIDTFERDAVIEFNPVGGGGTDFRPGIAAMEELEEPPIGVIYITDLNGRMPERAPEFPVLWASTQTREVPFGEVVCVE